MLKRRTFAIGITILVSSIIVFTAAAKVYQSAGAQTDIDAQRQAELRAWQEKVNAWNAAAVAKAQNTNLTNQGITQLPNTGPSEE